MSTARIEESVRLRCCIALIVCSVAPVPAQSILRVGPTRPFTELQPAIDAARAGDRILVDPGTYGPWSYPARVTIQKGVRITGQPGAVVTSVLVFGVPAGETVSLAGLEIRAAAAAPAGNLYCVSVVDCAGAVALDQCRLTASPCFNCDLFSSPRLWVLRSSLVIASQCTFSQSLGTPAASFSSATGMLTDCGTLSSQHGAIYRFGRTMWLPGAQGLDCVQGSLVQLARTSAQGGPGLPVFVSVQPGAGAAGVNVDNSELHLAGPASVTGGAGGDGSAVAQGGAGGPGVRQNGTLFHDAGVGVRGGAGGQGTPPGLPGPPILGTPPAVVSLPSLAVTTLQLPGGSFQLDGLAPPGTLLFLIVSFETLPMNVAGLRGTLAPRIDAAPFIEGPIVVNSSGRVARTIAIPPDPGLSGVVLFAQAAGIDPAAFPSAFFSAAVPLTVGF